MSYRFNLLFHEVVVQFSLVVWFHSLLVLPALGFKEQITDVRSRISVTFDNGEHYTIPHGVHQVAQPVVYR